MKAQSNIREYSYDIGSVRADFPILSTHVNGHPLVYLDSAASAQKPRVVIERMVHACYHEYANVHRGMHHLASAATDAFEGARETVRSFLNAKSVNEIIFTKSATEAINLVASSFGRANIGPGDEILLSVMEHHANIVPWHFLRERTGAILRWVDVGDDGSFSLEAFENAITPRTKIVAICHMSNVLGTVTPLADIVRIAHARDVPVLADGAQGAAHLDVDVRALDVDFYVITGHKLYGPTGVGALYGKADRLKALPPFLGGGEMIDRVTRDTVTYADPPHRLEAGTPPIIEAIGLGAALDYMRAIGRENIRMHEAALNVYAAGRLAEIDGLRIIGTAPQKGAITAFTIEGVHAQDVAMIIDRSGIAIRAGAHCAQPLLERFGVTSTCRASFALYNQFDEVDRLVEALKAARTMLL